MKFNIDETYEALSSRAVNDLAKITSSLKNPLICTASGDSPAGLYRELVERVKNKQVDVSNWFFLGLDEWSGMNGNDEGSCRYHLNQQLFHPLHVAEERICFFDGRSPNLEAECERIESFIRRHNGIDAAILGLGMNGHVGMNEPGTPITRRSHVAELEATTQHVGQKYFKKQQALKGGVTLGLATLMDARHLLLVVNGEHKSPIVQKVFEGNVSEMVPATLLRTHPSLTVYLDSASSRLMRNAQRVE